MSETHRLLQQYEACPKVCTDTRKVTKDAMYFALKGANFDGNQFAAQALADGCNLAVVDDPQVVDGERFVLVKDVLTALQDLATAWRRKFDIPVFAITGSNGKTTTKELMRDVLAKKFKVHATAGNFNNHIGVPLTLLSMPANTEFAIIEMGANHQKEIAALCKIAEPNFGYITNIGLAHLEGFGGPEGVYKGKKELFDYLAATKGEVFVYEYDEKVSDAAAKNAIHWFGGKKAKHLRSLKLDKQENGLQTEANYILPRGESGIFPSQLTGVYNAQNMAAAFAIGLHFGVTLEEAKEALSTYTPSNNRSQVTKTDHNSVIEDAYNANPSSMYCAIENLAEISGDKIAILGDMKELGDHAENEHNRVVQHLNSHAIQAILVGEEFGKFSRDFSHHFCPTTTEAMEYVKDQEYKGFTILIKGSNSMRLWELMEVL